MTKDFSVAWGSPSDPATAINRPFKTDEEAKTARNKEAAFHKAAGLKVRKFGLRAQLRPYWGWQEPCGIRCNIYSYEICF